MTADEKRKIEWAELLKDAIETPGRVAECYSRFWNYSVLNQMFVMTQCAMRGITPGPLNTYKGWLRLGRHVTKGSKAVFMWMPRTGHAVDTDPRTGEDVERTFTYFVCKPFWFVLSQTDGADYVPEPLPAWNAESALSALDVDLVPFAHTNGNVQGYATKRTVAVNPIGDHQTKTLLHEMAHVLLGHTADAGMEDGATLSRDVEEMEAEAVALLVGDALGLDGAAESRGYIQNWYKHDAIEDTSARRIITCADKILRAGRPAGAKAKADEAAA